MGRRSMLSCSRVSALLGHHGRQRLFEINVRKQNSGQALDIDLRRFGGKGACF